MLKQGYDYEIKDYTAEDLQVATELDLMIDQINGKEVESGFAIDTETAKWLSDVRLILTEIKENWEDYINSVEPPKEHIEETKMMLIQEMERLGVQKRPLWQRVADAFIPQPTPQLAYREEQASDLKLHGEEMLRKPGYVLRVSLGDKIVERELTEGEYLIGASPEADIQLVDQEGFISREHAQLIVRDGEIFMIDQGSKNGTFINGHRIESNTEVKIELNDKVSLADTILEFEAVPQDF